MDDSFILMCLAVVLSVILSLYGEISLQEDIDINQAKISAMEKTINQLRKEIK